MSVHSWMRNREVGCSLKLPLKKQACTSTDILNVKKKLWKSLYQKNTSKQDNFCKSYGGCQGVFDLKYTEDGNILVAACENSSVVLIDPVSNKTICIKRNAHTLRCNTITFIDERLFATCSDDTNISIWDVRNMKENAWLLKGHTSWVKNVEYHKKTKQLVSAGFDDQVLVWNINDCLGSDHLPQLLFKCANLTRMRLSPDGNSMYLSTVLTADLIAIHNLDLDKLSLDVGEINSHPVTSGRILTYKNGCLYRDRSSINQSSYQSVSNRNHVELYHGYYESGASDDTVCVATAVDVHPENLAVLMRYDWMPSNGLKCLTMHNTWSYYNGYLQGNNSNWNRINRPKNEYLPLLRGQPTHILNSDEIDNENYIQEVAFSPCGRLISSPCGFGLRILSLDQDMSDYRTNISSRICDLERQFVNTERTHITLVPNRFQTAAFCFGHRDLVLSTCFSPVRMQVVSGSKDGNIVFHEVIL